MIERTFAIIKPHAVAEGNSGAIIDRIEQEGFSIVDKKEIHMSQEQAEKLYAVHEGKPFFESLLKNITASPCIVMVLEKENAIADWRSLMGATNPAKAEEGTLRKKFGTSLDTNATHGSDAPETARTEIGIFFPTLV